MLGGSPAVADMDMGKLVLADIDMGRQGKLVPDNAPVQRTLTRCDSGTLPKVFPR